MFQRNPEDGVPSQEVTVLNGNLSETKQEND
jgi:hypothetical protein